MRGSVRPLVLLLPLLLLACTRPAAQAAPLRTLPQSAGTVTPRIPLRQVELEVADGFPVWLESEGRRTEQTSGLSFVERTPEGRLLFFSCDDTGALHRFEITLDARPPGATTGDGWLRIIPLAIPGDLKPLFGTGDAKLDLEETAVCRSATGASAWSFLVAVEGNASAAERAVDPRMHEGRNEMVTVAFDAPFAEATQVTRVEPFLQAMVQPAWDAGWESPWEGYQQRDTLPLAGMEPNRGFEGVAMGGPRERTGLSPLRTEMWFAPEMAYPKSPLIPDAWQGQIPLFHSIQDAADGSFALRVQFLPEGCVLASVCGLALTPDGETLYVLDRNLQRIHRIALAADGAFASIDTAQLALTGPGGIPYFTPSLESLTIDDTGRLWTITDPWKYTPLPREGQTLSEAHRKRFAAEVPLLYMFEPWPD